MKLVPGLATAVLVALLASSSSCGGTQGSGPPPGPTRPAEPAYAATRWIPARPSYAFAARSVREAQRGTRDLLDGVAAPFGLVAQSLTAELVAFLGVDLLSEAAVAGVGVDLDSSIAVFSDGANPTLVVHLADPEKLMEFLEARKARGLSTQSVVVEGVEVTTAKWHRTAVSWAIADGWFWLHFQLPIGRDDSASWFAATRQAGGAAKPWAQTWDWARATVGEAADGIVGFADPAVLLSGLKRVDDARACLELAAPVSRVAFGIEGDGTTTQARVAIDVGAAAAAVTAATHPVAAGWAAAGAAAPMAVELNLDLGLASKWVGPCLLAANVDANQLAQYGITSGRAILLSFAPDEMMSSTGVVAVDLTSKRYLAGLLDQIPMRSMAEKKRTFGSLPGYHLSIPFGPSVDYILTDTHAFAAAGDGLLERAVGTGAPVPGALAKLDVRFDAMPPAAWSALLDLVVRRGVATVVYTGLGARFLQGVGPWREAHASLSLQGSALVLDASATRR